MPSKCSVCGCYCSNYRTVVIMDRRISFNVRVCNNHYWKFLGSQNNLSTDNLIRKENIKSVNEN